MVTNFRVHACVYLVFQTSTSQVSQPYYELVSAYGSRKEMGAGVQPRSRRAAAALNVRLRVSKR